MARLSRGLVAHESRELGFRVSWSRSLSYVSWSVWAFGWRAWVLLGWSWRWR